MILLSESQWTDRLSQIYDLFISVGTEEMYKEDIQLLLFAAPSSLGKVWREALPEHQVLALAEHLADLAVVKVCTHPPTPSHLYVLNCDSRKGFLSP